MTYARLSALAPLSSSMAVVRSPTVITSIPGTSITACAITTLRSDLGSVNDVRKIICTRAALELNGRSQVAYSDYFDSRNFNHSLRDYHFEVRSRKCK